MLRESRVHEFRREIELVVETCQLSSSRCTYSFNWGSHLRLQTVNLIYFLSFFWVLVEVTCSHQDCGG
jgi:hypothetical protein